MAKDPAFLFYSSDFLTGTMFMTNEQVGKYIRLLCAQHQTGHLSEKDMINICGSHDEVIFNKFKKDSDGKYYNERCEEEILKRKAFSQSRSNNRKGKSKDMINISKSYVKHMENENEDINDIIIIDGITIKDVLPILEIYEAQLNGMARENNNIAWRPMVNKWLSEHIGEEFKDNMHVKNSFKRFYLNNKPIKDKVKSINQTERLKNL